MSWVPSPSFKSRLCLKGYSKNIHIQTNSCVLNTTGALGTTLYCSEVTCWQLFPFLALLPLMSVYCELPSSWPWLFAFYMLAIVSGHAWLMQVLHSTHTWHSHAYMSYLPTKNDTGTDYNMFLCFTLSSSHWCLACKTNLKSFLCVCCSQAADCPGGAPYSGSGEGEPGAEAEGWDQHSQAGGTTTAGATWGHREWTESPKVCWRRAGTGTCKVIHMI